MPLMLRSRLHTRLLARFVYGIENTYSKGKPYGYTFPLGLQQLQTHRNEMCRVWRPW